MWQKTVFLLLIFFIVVYSDHINDHQVKLNFRTYPLELVVKMVVAINEVNAIGVKYKECLNFHLLHGKYYSEFAPDDIEWLKWEAKKPCLSLVYHHRMADMAFAIVAEREIVSLYKAAELKSLWLKVNKNRELFTYPMDTFQMRLKSLIRAEKQEFVFHWVVDIFIEVQKEMEAYVEKRFFENSFK